ncbi:Serine-pyruvate aminotransferase [Klebsiella pneumoniae]|uniref:Serine-pyruvate aminotransferase n=1 Tax=Klebsiella pneumoniae TaxID=573 RepID=A0A447RGS6_KLEPN|nr:Serine-pyruvate aminotransferase [Klebsiella pneumoniae]
MDITQFSQINPPQRLLMGPGPINADPRVLRAMSSQLVGQYDPAMTHYMNEVMALYRGVFRTENRWTMLVDGTSRAGIEAILLSAIRPGDKVLVPVFGRFGHLLCEIARRCRAEVHTIEVPWGQVFTPDQIEDAIKRVRPRLLLTVQGDTSTTMLQPLAELGEICRRHDVLFYTTPPHRSAVTRWKPTPGSWTRCPPGCRSAWAVLPAPRPSPSARGWKRSSAAAAALSRGSAPMPITMASTR